MAKTFRIPTDRFETFEGQLSAARLALAEIAEELRMDWDKAAKKWQVSAEGEQAADWLDQLDEKVEELEDFELPALPS